MDKPINSLEALLRKGHNIIRQSKDSHNVQSAFIFGMTESFADTVNNLMLAPKNLLQKNTVAASTPYEFIQTGSRDSSGNHGELGRYSLPEELMFLTDYSRKPFDPFYFITVKGDSVYIGLTKPQSGGLRGVASHSDIILMKLDDIPPGADLTPVISFLPKDVPLKIGEAFQNIPPINWKVGELSVNLKKQRIVLHTIFNLMGGKLKDLEHYGFKNQEETVRFFLDVFSFMPREYRARFPTFKVNFDNSIEINPRGL